MTEKNETTVETTATDADLTPVFTDATPAQAGTPIGDLIDDDLRDALTKDEDGTTEAPATAEVEADTEEAAEAPQVEEVPEADSVEDVTEAAEEVVTEDDAPAEPVEDTADEITEEAPVAESVEEAPEVEAEVEVEVEKADDAPDVPDSPEAEAPVEDTAEPVEDTSDEAQDDPEEDDITTVVVEKFEEAIEDEEIDLYPKIAKINKTAFKNLLNSNKGYDEAASEAFRAEEEKQARKIVTKTLREVFRDNAIKMKPDEFEAQYPEAYDQVLSSVFEKDASYAEWEAVTNSVGDENFVHYVEGLSLPFGTSSKQDIEEAVTKVVDALGLSDVDAADSAKNVKTITTAVKKALKGNGDVKFAVVWRQNAADVVSYFPFESRTAEIVSPVLLAVAVKAKDAPRSVKLDPVTAQAKLVGTYTFEHHVTEGKDGATVSNVSVYGPGELPNKESYYEREVEFGGEDSED